MQDRVFGPVGTNTLDFDSEMRGKLPRNVYRFLNLTKEVPLPDAFEYK